MARDGDLDLPSSISGSADDDERAWRLELAALRERAEGAAEGILPREDIDGVAAVEAAWADEAVAVDRQLRALALEIARRDVELVGWLTRTSTCGIDGAGSVSWAVTGSKRGRSARLGGVFLRRGLFGPGP